MSGALQERELSGQTELTARIGASGLSRIVSHRELILPQLAGPGVAAHLVKKSSGFKVIYGPIRAIDLPAFLDSGFKATPEMRLKTFTLWERVELIPVDLVRSLKAAFILMAVLFLTDSLWRTGGFWPDGAGHGLHSVLAILVAVLSGAVLTPLLLPWLPGRAFALKGMVMGALSAFVLIPFWWSSWETGREYLELAAWFLIIPAISAYLGMKFTGSSTYTSLSGVRKEMHWAVPLEIGAGIFGLGLWLGSRFIS